MSLSEAIIPLSCPSIGKAEQEAVLEVLRSGRTGGHGPIGEELQRRIESMLGVRHVLMTPSAARAIELGLWAAGVGAKDEVILPSFTHASVANAIQCLGARPVFAEVSDATLDLDPELLEGKITERTRAIVPAHYAGVGAPMEAYRAIASARDIVLVEDAAQGFGARRGGRWLGTLGDIGAFSFHETKNLGCGEGGAFLTDREDLFERAELIHQHGTNRSNFLRGEVDRYRWIAAGGSFAFSDILAAILRVQIARMDEIHAARRRIVGRYEEGLRDLAQQGKLRLPSVPANCESNAHIFYVRFASEAERDRVQREMRSRGIQCSFHFVPLHCAPQGLQLGNQPGDLPVTEQAAATLLRLPLYAELSGPALERVLAGLHEILA